MTTEYIEVSEILKAKEMTTQYIDATPTWEGITSSLLIIYEGSKTPKNRQWAKDEILKMARLADQFVELTKNVNETNGLTFEENLIDTSK